jgi:hypothetical protein
MKVDFPVNRRSVLGGIGLGVGLAVGLPNPSKEKS